MKAFNTTHGEKLLLISCGILKKEIDFLIQKNNWPVETHFLNSSLHIDFEKLSTTLSSKLRKFKERRTIAFYGTCHPLMDQIMDDSNTIRSPGQNCAEMLLGNTLFNEELSQGAYFLLEDWAHRWDEILEKTFGSNPGVIKEIFRGDRAYLLALRTPCSGNFESGARHAAETVGVPLRWRDVSLDHLETILKTIILTKLGNQ